MWRHIKKRTLFRSSRLAGRRSQDPPRGTPLWRWRRYLAEQFRKNATGEAPQAKIRAVITLLLIFYGFGYAWYTGDYERSQFVVYAAWAVFVVLMLAWVLLAPEPSLSRRVTSTVADRAIFSWIMATYGQWAGPVYILYIWGDLGDASRYGRPYLYFSTLCSGIGFGVVILVNSYWQSLIPLSAGLWFGVLLAPYYSGLFHRRLIEANNRLRDLATRDTLTGLPNRAFFYERLREAISTAARHGRHFTILFVDLDNFKRINDTFGHEVGDDVLRAAARILRDSIRKEDVVARLGGDEFVVLLHEAHGRKLHIADNLREAIAAYADRDLSASIGIAAYPHCGQEAEMLVRHADQAMYQAKQAGKNRCRACPDIAPVGAAAGR